MQQISPSPSPSPPPPLLLHHHHLHASGRNGSCHLHRRRPCTALVVVSASAAASAAPTSSSSSFSAFSSLLVLDPRPSPPLFLLSACKFSKHRFPSLLPSRCSRRDLDILSIKELPDGSLHFSFGIPNETNGLAFTNKVVSPSRPPSQFVRKSPIPIMATRRRHKQEVISIKDGALSSIPGSMVLLRPKSCFVKRSPITKPTIINRQILPLDQKITNDEESGVVLGTLNGDITKRWPSRFIKRSPIPLLHGRLTNLKEDIADSLMEVFENGDKPMRWPSRFVKSSPIPPVRERYHKVEVKAADSTRLLVNLDKPSRWPSKFAKKSPIPSLHGSTSNLEEKAVNSTIDVRRKTTAFQSSRPKSKFARTSPIVKMPHHNADAVSKMEILGDTNSVQSTRPTSVFIKKSPIVKVHHHAPPEVDVEDESLKKLSKGKTPDNAYANKVSGILKQSSDGRNDNIVDLDKCKLPELKSLAKTRGLKGYSKLRKAELLALLKGQL